MKNSNYLITSQCKNCKENIITTFHTKQCPFCNSFNLEHKFIQNFKQNSELDKTKLSLERIFQHT